MFRVIVEITGYKQEYCYECNVFDRCPFVADMNALEYDEFEESYLRADNCLAAEIKYKNSVTMGELH